jgi:hypothetical protein
MSMFLLQKYFTEKVDKHIGTNFFGKGGKGKRVTIWLNGAGFVH